MHLGFLICLRWLAIVTALLPSVRFRWPLYLMRSSEPLTGRQNSGLRPSQLQTPHRKLRCSMGDTGA